MICSEFDPLSSGEQELKKIINPNMDNKDLVIFSFIIAKIATNLNFLSQNKWLTLPSLYID